MCDNATDGNSSDGIECPTCGDEFDSERALNIHKGHKHSDKPWRDANLLREMWGEGMTAKEIASELGCGRTTVGNWIDKHDIGDDHECPTCGVEFPTEQGMKCHHNQVHDENISGVPKECKQCGVEFRVKPSHHKGRTFCSRECQADWRSVNYIGEDNPRWSGGLVEKMCEHCESTYTVRQHKANKTRFCSRACIGKWYSGERSATWDGGGVVLNCDQCGSEYQVRRAKKDLARFCSRKCKGKWQSENQTGEDNPNYRGGWFPYGPGWNEPKKEKVRDRDGRKCVQCGRTEEEHLEKFGRKHDVHHIQKARSFDDPERRNAMDNLVTLCVSEGCHQRWEMMSPLRPQTD